MAGRRHERGARLLRLLGVLTVVAGVFAMHGLTSHHDVAMIRAGTPTVVTEHPAEVVQVAPADDMPDMGGACMAVLTGLVLLLSLLLGLRSLLVWRALGKPGHGMRRVLGERAPPVRGPLLWSLGVLRI